MAPAAATSPRYRYPIAARQKREAIMKSLLLSALALTAMASFAMAEPTKLTEQQMEKVAAGAITQQRTNPAGNTTQGQGQAITVTNVNPAGKAPSGQNK